MFISEKFLRNFHHNSTIMHYFKKWPWFRCHFSLTFRIFRMTFRMTFSDIYFRWFHWWHLSWNFDSCIWQSDTVSHMNTRKSTNSNISALYVRMKSLKLKFSMLINRFKCINVKEMEMKHNCLSVLGRRFSQKHW